MQKIQTIEDYKRRIMRVVEYIYAHLDEPLDNETLAEVACFSPYHWHRIYHAMTGETAAQTVRRLRLHRAGGELVHSQASIPDIAERAGYGSVEAFNRAFRKAYQLPPAAFRDSRVKPELDNPEFTGDALMFDVEITNYEPLSLAAVPHTGSYMGSGEAFDKLFIWAGPKGLLNGPVRMVGVHYDDPDEVAEENLRMHAGLVVADDFVTDGPTEMVTLEGGPCAVLHYKGPYAELSTAYRWLFGQWLPKSGREAGDAPCFEEYLNSPRDVLPSELLTDVVLPLKG